MSELLTVSMPTYNTDPRLLRRAVDSVLAQDYPNLRLVVINDGGGKINLPKDERLFTLNIKENKGRYFCDAVTLLSLEEGFFAVHDSDDWAEPGMYSALMSGARTRGVSLAPYWRHEIGKDPYVWHVKDNPNKKFISIVSWVSAVYSVERMWKAGGIDPTFRVGFDTLHTLLITNSGGYQKLKTPYYHYEKTKNSLTTSEKSGMKTQMRLESKKRIMDLYEKSKIYQRKGGQLRNLIYMSAPREVRQEVEKYAAELKYKYNLAK